MKTKSRTYLIFFAVVALFAVGLMLAWPALDTGAAIAAAGCLLAGAVVGFLRVRADQHPPGVFPFPSLVNALPKGWGRWMTKGD